MRTELGRGRYMIDLMGADVRLGELGFSPLGYRYQWHSRLGKRRHQMGGYDQTTDSFLMLQETGVGGGAASSWVKATTLRRNWSPIEP